MNEKTFQNLKDAFAGESQANRKYLAFAKKADKEGFKEAVKLFKAAAESETIHALSHLKKMGDIKSTEENLKQAIKGETYEFEKMYPKMIQEAEEEGEENAKKGFEFANTVEKEHADLYKKVLENLGKNEKVDYWICQGCGHVNLNEAPEVCPVCGAPKSMFKKIE